MELFLSSLSQMAFLLLLIIIGYVLARLGVIEENSGKILSKLEIYLFIPGLVFSTFIKELTVETLKTDRQYLLCGFIVVAISILFAFPVSKVLSKDGFKRKIFQYGLSFPNSGFMGNAVVLSLFPDLFMKYLIFTIPFTLLTYMWAVPNLLMPSGQHRNLSERLKTLLNPMILSVIIGSIIGLSGLHIPKFIGDVASALGNCMPPIAMILTGVTIAGIKIGKLFNSIPVYIASVIRLLIIPIAGMIILKSIGISFSLALCTVCTLAMPLGLNTIVIPEAYGKDTSIGAGMVVISHSMSCITIPFIFYLFERLFS